MTESFAKNDAELIKLAYAMAVGPHRYEQMNTELEARLSDVSVANDDQDLDALAVPAFAGLEPHFENALSLIRTQGRKYDTVRGSIRYIDSDSRPAALIKSDGVIYHANDAARQALGLLDGERPDESAFEYGHYSMLLANLGRLEPFAFETVISIFGMIAPGDQKILKVALRKTLNADGEVMGQLSAVNISWLPGTGAEFQSVFNLTPTEIDITKAIVMGMSLSDLAQERGRALGTVRQQTKTLFAKLNLKSQTELACLYSGFSEIHANANKASADYVPLEPWRKCEVLMRPNGRIIDYEIVGNPNGRPVLFFPALLGGMTLTNRMRSAIAKNNIRLIMVWRPYMASSAPDGPADISAFENYARDVEALLDHLGVERCAAMGHITASMFAYGCAKFYLTGLRASLMSMG